MAGDLACDGPLPGTGFGGRSHYAGDVAACVAAAEAAPQALPWALAASSGVLLISGMGAMADDPGLRLRLSRIFRHDVEDDREIGRAATMIHPTAP